MKNVKLSDELVAVLISEAVDRIAGNLKRVPAGSDPREVLAKHRKDRKARKANGDYDPDANFLEAIFAADREAYSFGAPLTITLPPRIAAGVAWEAVQRSRTPEQQAVMTLVEAHKDNAIIYDGEYQQAEWMTAGSVVEPIAKAEFEDHERRMARHAALKEVAS